MQPNKLALPFAAAVLLGLAACAGRAPIATAILPPAAPLAADPAVRMANWTNPTVTTLNVTDHVVAPDTIGFLVGEPVQLLIRNVGTRETTLRAPAFFRAVAVRTVAETVVEPPFQPRGFTGDRMEKIAFEGVPQLLRLTPHEQEVAKRSPNPFDAPPAPPTPIDFGNLLGNLGANPFGAGAAAAAADAAAPAAEGAPAAPANPFDILGGLAAQAAAPPPPPPAPEPTPPVPTATPAEAAAAGVAVQPGVTEAHEETLLKEWGAGQIAGLESITLAPGAAVYVTFVPLRPGTYSLGGRGEARILSPEEATLAPEVAAPAGDVQLYRAEAKAP